MNDLELQVNFLEDRTFKIMFLHQDILDYFLLNLFDYLNECKIDIEHVDAEDLIPADSIYLRDYYGDIIAYGKKEYVSIEAFSSKKNYNRYKSLLYAARLFGNQLEYGEETRNCKNVISINIIDGRNTRKKNGIRDYGIVEKRNHERFPNNPFTYIEVFLNNIVDIPYTKEEHEFITFLRLMACKNINDMRKYVGRNKVMENAVKYIEDYYSKTAKIKHEGYLSDAREIGKSEGRTEGVLATECNIVKNMHDNNINDEDIAKMTNIPLKRVRNLLSL